MGILIGLITTIIAASKKLTGFAIAMGIWTGLLYFSRDVFSRTSGQAFSIAVGLLCMAIAIGLGKNSQDAQPADAGTNHAPGSSSGTQKDGTVSNNSGNQAQDASAGNSIIDANTPIIAAAPPVPLPPERTPNIPVCLTDIPYGRTRVSFSISPNGDPCTVGRTNEANVILNADDEALSRCQFILVCSGGNYFISDAGSTQGTFLNGTPLFSGSWSKVNSGDRILAGGTEYYIMFGADIRMVSKQQ